MPSVLEDPAAPVVYRTSGGPPFLTHLSPLPVEIVPRQVTLRDRITAATLVPFSAPHQLPPSLLSYICDLLNREIEGGDTYPMDKPMTLETFAPYWFGNFGAVMLLGDSQSVDDLLSMPTERKTWESHCLGSFYIKPNYPGRSSHVCNGGFLVSDLARNRGVGRLMGEGYLEWAPKLGYSYSVFNLVYDTNVASCRIWDSLGFKRIGRVKGCGNLRSYPDRLVDAIQYGRDLGPEGEEYASEERFDKIRFYLKQGKYPDGADRAEKSRLRSAATHYRLVPGETDDQDKLMLKDKEVISDANRQYEIAKSAHEEHHAGINKTTATVAEKYHWVGIKTSVSLAIKNCPDCREISKIAPLRAAESSSKPSGIDADLMAVETRDPIIYDSSTTSEPTLHHHLASGDGVPIYSYNASMPVDPQLTQKSSEAYSSENVAGEDSLGINVVGGNPAENFGSFEENNFSTSPNDSFDHHAYRSTFS